MTTDQLARCGGTDTAWLFNTERRLGRRFGRHERGARELATVHLLHAELGLPLTTAARIAEQECRSRGTGPVSVATTQGGSGSIVLDRDRFSSVFLANLAAANAMGATARGRPPVGSGDPVSDATRFGIDISLVRSQLARPVVDRLNELDRQAEFVRNLPRSR